MAPAEQILNKVVQQIAQEHNLQNYDIKVEPISSGGANFTSTLFNVTFSKGDDVIHMFAKVAAIGEKMRSQTPKFYQTEHFAYTKLLKVYERLEEEHQVPKEHRVAFPKCYACDPTEYEETVVLEDLVKAGYQAYERIKPFDWKYAESALRELAKMHALSFAYGEYHAEEFNKVVDGFKFEMVKNDNMKQLLDDSSRRAIETTHEANKDKMKRFFDADLVDKFAEYCQWGKRPVLGHGDYRPSNLMHRSLDDGSIDIKIVDLQTLQGGSPAIDLLYFLITGSDEAFRAQYYEKCLDHYYSELAAAMKRFHLDPEKVYSREDFDYELEKKLPFGLTIAVFSLPIITVDPENAPKVGEDMDMSTFSVDKPSELFRERLNGVVNDYVKWGVLK